MNDGTHQTDSNSCLEDYERLKANITMFLSDINRLTSVDVEFLTKLNSLRMKYLANIEVY